MATTEPSAILEAGRRFGGLVQDDTQRKIAELQLLCEISVGAGWDPSYFDTALRAWFRPVLSEIWSDSLGALAVPGGSVEMWRDASGQGNHLVQTTGADKPILSASADLNDYYTVQTDGVSDSIGVTFAAPFVDAFTVAAVLRCDEFRIAQQEQFVGSNSSVAGSRCLLYHIAGFSDRRCFIGSGATQSSGVWSAGLVDFYFMAIDDGLERFTTRLGSRTISATPGDQLPGLRLGSETTINFAKASYAEAIVLNRAMTQIERAQLTLYFANKYGIS